MLKFKFYIILSSLYAMCVSCNSKIKNTQDILENKSSIKVGKILICNDTILNCKISQKDKSSEIDVFSIAFIDKDIAIIHSYSSAGHTDEDLTKVKYVFKNNRLILKFPDKYLTLNKTYNQINEKWVVKERDKDKVELEYFQCDENDFFKVTDVNYYCSNSINQEYKDDYNDIMNLIKNKKVESLLKEIEF